MEKKKDSKNEDLIRELYEKLDWYTYYAPDNEMNAQEMDEILQRLDVLDPIEDSGEEETYFCAENAFQRFWKRFRKQ